MVRGLLQPAGAATAAAWWPCSPVLAHRRSLPNEEQLNQVRCMNHLRWKLPLSAAKSYKVRSHIGCSNSGPSTEVARVSRAADVFTAQSDLSMTRFMDSVPDVVIVISGYWTGPDVDDGCGSVEAMLQRIA